MPGRSIIGIVSDIHYASAAEQARGTDYEYRSLANPLLRHFVRLYRYHVWLRHPLEQNHLLERFLNQSDPFDYVVANGDYSCDSAFVGVSDEAVFQSARGCLDKLRGKFGERLRINFGDHELGKVSFVGGQGGMRVASWRRAREELGLAPFWRLELGNYVLLGLVSSLVALPALEPDTLEAERPEWARLRAEHLSEIREAFASLRPGQRVMLFCHDPTALPFLAEEEAVRARMSQIEQTIIGHLHSNLVWWKSRLLAGMPRIGFLGHTARRLSTALRKAREWRAFQVRLCPALAGIQLLNDGGYYTAELDPEARQPARFVFHRILR
ncbi:conserved hypothetical protein [Verrucomicrobia bacterium]|nr:conserved hypothetical protein [Verrucomicrobiota bacterium]